MGGQITDEQLMGWQMTGTMDSWIDEQTDDWVSGQIDKQIGKRQLARGTGRYLNGWADR